MPALTYRPIKVWPEGWDPARPPMDPETFRRLTEARDLLLEHAA